MSVNEVLERYRILLAQAEGFSAKAARAMSLAGACEGI
jgi:hypothetical protein